MTGGRLQGSFRDPSGFVFLRAGEIHRQIQPSYRPHYDRLMDSGLYAALAGEGLLVPHVEVSRRHAPAGGAYKVIRAEKIPFVSYPYEWCFGQLRDAALATLEIQERALSFGMTLKDASAFNIQFRRGRPVLIDTLSFEIYREGQVWVPYQQFCRHFLAPLALTSRVDARLAQLLRVHLDGIPLDLASRLLPKRSWLSPGLLLHLHMHALAQRRCTRAGRVLANPERPGAMPPRKLLPRRLSPGAMRGLVDSLRSTVRGLAWRPPRGGWASYDARTSYAPEGQEEKLRIVADFLDRMRPGTVWDLGANTGPFSRLAARRGAQVIAFDLDPACVEACYAHSKESGETRVLPLVLDLANPSAGLGWANRERMSLLERGPADAVLALALVHHLAIGNNVPLAGLAETLSGLAEWLVIEFVPKADPQVREMLAARADVFHDYTRECFEEVFGRHYAIEAMAPVPRSERRIYLMRRRD